MDLSNYPNVKVLEHPLLKHKITHLRDVNTQTNDFRKIVKEIAIMQGYEALRNIPTHNIDVVTPIETSSEPVIDYKKICFVPILRAGLGMVDGMIELVPNAKVGHVGLYRDEVTKIPVEYYVKLPNSIKDCDVYLLDPMLATGGSAIGAINTLKKYGAKKITFICIIAAPEGVKALANAFPDLPIIIGTVDRQLNENAYICPGLGDCGDRIFGTTKND
jgi:uracil phosphoribosyltransferase